MNNNQQKRSKKKSIKKQKIKNAKNNAQKQEKIEFENRFIDLISYSEPSSPIQEQNDPLNAQNNVQSNKQQQKNQKEEKRQIIWKNLPANILKVNSLMVIGPKNTGKSTLCSHLIANNPQNHVLLDCDIGKNSILQGCVSLSHKNQHKKIWIGQLTPMNNLQIYLQAIKHLYNFYRQVWFGKKLIVNTMGYTSGLGELLQYQLFEIIKPFAIIALKLPQKVSSGFDTVKEIVNHISSGTYVNKLLVSCSKQMNNEIFPTSTTIYHYQNTQSVSKKGIPRFERHFCTEKRAVSSIYDLVNFIHSSKSPFSTDKLFSKSRENVLVLEQKKHWDGQGEQFKKVSHEECIDMRIVVLGSIVEGDSHLFMVQGLGFCYKNTIYSLNPLDNVIGLISEGIDFQKSFYHLNQRQMIDLQLRYGKVPYLLVSAKALGSKGVRNNPSKTQSS